MQNAAAPNGFLRALALCRNFVSIVPLLRLTRLTQIKALTGAGAKFDERGRR